MIAEFILRIGQEGFIKYIGFAVIMIVIGITGVMMKNIYKLYKKIHIIFSIYCDLPDADKPHNNVSLGFLSLIILLSYDKIRVLCKNSIVKNPLFYWCFSRYSLLTFLKLCCPSRLLYTNPSLLTFGLIILNPSA